MARPRVAPPSVDKYFELMCSRPVKIIVGSGPEKKTYTVPKDLLSHYSPYFRGAFNGGFREGVEGELRLGDDKKAFFDVFLEYCRKGEAIYKPDGLAQRRLQLQSCLEFIKFCDKYDLGQVMDAVEVAFRRLLNCGASKHLDPEDVSELVNCLDEDSEIFRLLMQACVRETFREDSVTIPTRLADESPYVKKFSALMREDDTVAAGMMRELVIRKVGDKRAFVCAPLLLWKAV